MPIGHSSNIRTFCVPVSTKPQYFRNRLTNAIFPWQRHIRLAACLHAPPISGPQHLGLGRPTLASPRHVPRFRRWEPQVSRHACPRAEGGIIKAMQRIGLLECFLVAALFGKESAAQERIKPLEPGKAKTSYSFPIHGASTPFRFDVQLDTASTITGVQVFRPGDSSPFQTLPACKRKDDLTMVLTEYDDDRELLKHQDLNFDGFEDVQLLQYYVPHLGKSLFCIYVWNPQDERFAYSAEIPDMDPVAHPQNQTITVHEDWFGGVFSDRTYRWSGATVKLVVENGRLYGSERPDCGFTEYCSRLINGKMVTSAERPSGCENNEPPMLVCPSTIPNIPPTKQSSPQRKK